MSILAFFFIGGLTLKGAIILIDSSINRLSLKYDTKIIAHPAIEGYYELSSENKKEMKVVSNPSSPLGKQIHLRLQRNPAKHEVQLGA